MWRISKLLIIILINSINLTSQNSLEVRYVQTTRLPGLITQSANLYYKDGISIYIHSQGKKGTVMKNMDGTDWSGNINTSFMSWYQDSIGVIFFKDYQSKVIKFREFFASNAYISQEDFPTFKWSVIKEIKKVNNFNCYKATTSFRGRNYTAWFTMDIPVQDGPWKFWGLPGLILEIYDDKNEVHFLAESIIYPFNNKINFNFPTDGNRVDLTTYRKSYDIEQEKKLRAYESKDYGRGVQISISRNKNDRIEKNYND